MTLTPRRVALAARIALPLAIAGDFAAAASALVGPAVAAARFGLAYATALLLLIVLRRRALAETPLAAVALLTVIWAIRTPGDDLAGLAAAIAGAACAVVPAAVRDLARVARRDDRVSLSVLRRRRRALPLLPDLRDRR